MGISENTNVQWEDPSHRLSVIAGSQAAHRLSTFKTPPNDEDDLNQYIEDQKKVSIAVDVLKENKTGNMGQYKQAVQSIDENIDLILEEQSKQSDKDDGSPLFKLVINDGDDDQSIDNPKTTTLSILNVTPSNDTEQKEEKTKKQKHRRVSSTYNGFRIQIDQLNSQKDDNGILNVKHSTFVDNVNEYHKNKRVTLTNSHNFLWFVTAVQSASSSAERESEITRKSLDKILNLLPIPFRDKIWEVCNIDNETYLFQEDYSEFVDALLVATGQIRVDEDEELDFEIRDMTDVFIQIIDIDMLFKDKDNISKWSQSVSCLSTLGATKIVMKAKI